MTPDMKNILLLGDSIRRGYESFARDKLQGRANVFFPMENGRFAQYTLRALSEWKESMALPQMDVVHWNNGLWDAVHLNDQPPDGEPGADPEFPLSSVRSSGRMPDPKGESMKSAGNGKTAAARDGGGTILYLDMEPEDPSKRMKLAGIRRYAALRGWEVACIARNWKRRLDIRSVLKLHDPLGVVVEGAARKFAYPPRLFGQVPVAYIEYPAGEVAGKAPNVVVDDTAVAAAAFRELSLGKPAAFAAVGHMNPHLFSRLRIRAFRRQCAECGCRCRVFSSRWREPASSHEERLARWLAKLPRNTAVFAATNAAAAAVTRAAAAAMRHIPKDISLVAFGDIPEICENASPPITSIRFDFERMGFVAARALSCRSRDMAIGPLLVTRRKSTSGRGRHEPWVLKAVEIIRAEACGGLDIGNLVRRLETETGSPVSRRNFDRRFCEAVGHTANEEILSVRLETACALLSQTDTPVMAIPDFCGFGCYRTLDAVFRSRFKMSMRLWRERNSR